MPLSTQDAIRDVFLDATRQQLLRGLQTPQDVERLNAISSEAETRIAQEETTFAKDYDMRLADARQVILREKTGLFLEKPRPIGATHISDAAQLDLEADQRVRHDHTRRIAVIKTDELHQMQDLRSEVRGRDAMPSELQERFRMASQTPSLTRDRKGPSQTR